MPLLLYCVAPESARDTDVSGVGEAPVHSKVEKGLKFFYSQADAAAISSDKVVQAAQQVHAVITDIFSRSPVLPFRYPTLVAREDELADLVDERGPKFREYFERVGSKVQMDVRLAMATQDLHNPSGSPAPDLAPDPAQTGRAYLQQRARSQASLSLGAEKCRQAAHSAEWRIQQGGENIRCQALISRVEVVSFLERMRTLELPSGVKAAVSGPWPPAGFWEDEPC